MATAWIARTTFTATSAKKVAQTTARFLETTLQDCVPGIPGNAYWDVTLVTMETTAVFYVAKIARITCVIRILAHA